ncbi:MAG: hypothetical protein HYS06_11665 [Methylocystis sp.]|nr:hypothetical protein [Methylocystis sp.]
MPQPSKTYGETVCCAGVTIDRQWKRLFPVRFRHLKGESSFSRWDWIKFKYRRPKSDTRAESCHVYEESITVDGSLHDAERTRLLTPMLLKSAKEAAALGHSLALIRPRNTRFIWKLKTKAEINEEREAFRLAARQPGMFDKELAELEPSPYDFRFKFEDDGGSHNYQNGDWEAHAMFWRESQRTSAAEALKWMDGKFNDEFPKRGMAFAIGNQAKRPHVWQLLGVIRLDETSQGELF